jgi:hypothetical protein
VIAIAIVLVSPAASRQARADSSDIPTSPTDQIAGCPVASWPASSLVQCVFESASAFRNQNTKWRGTECPGQSSAYWGHCACAAAVSVVILNATLKDLGFINVDQFEDVAKVGKYGGGFVPDAKARPGDVILWYSADRGEGHVGICATTGCTRTWSNSSSHGTFAPVDHSISFDNFYPIHEIWEPRHLP